MIVAASERGVIGRGGKLPWRIPSDLRRFKSLTMGHAYIVGRRTWDEVGKPLPGRRMIVVTRATDRSWPEGVIVVSSIDAAFGAAERIERDETFVGGGAEIFALALPRIDRIYLTRVHGEVSGDTVVPMLDGKVPEGFVAVAEPEPLDPAGATHAATFLVYDREPPRA